MRVLRAIIVLATGAGLAPAGAAGASQLLRISGATRVAAGQSAKLTISGHARGRHGLAIYLDAGRCARGVAAEDARGISRQLVIRAVRGSFKHTLTFVRSSSGTHYICAYLYHGRHGGFVTDRRAAFHYVTH